MVFQQKIKENFSLKELTTFKIGGVARYFVGATSVTDVLRALQFAGDNGLDLFVLGGGSNVLISDRGFSGLVLRPELRGFNVVAQDDRHVWLNVAAGEPWDGIVAQTVDAGWWGLENLSAIPGNCGALAVQNVGAYGQEASSVIEAVEGYEIATGERKTFINQECGFSYRSSIFNTTLKGKYVITSITFCLQKQGTSHIEYRDLREAFAAGEVVSLQSIRAAVLTIRERKLPDPNVCGNAGSFFKNVLLSAQEFVSLRQSVSAHLGEKALDKLCSLTSVTSCRFPVKIPTAFLLILCGVTGARVGGAALSRQHPLIMVNVNGEASAHHVLMLMRRIRQEVYALTGLTLMPEPNFIGFTEQELAYYFSLSE